MLSKQLPPPPKCRRALCRDCNLPLGQWESQGDSQDGSLHQLGLLIADILLLPLCCSQVIDLATHGLEQLVDLGLFQREILGHSASIHVEVLQGQSNGKDPAKQLVLGFRCESVSKINTRKNVNEQRLMNRA